MKNKASPKLLLWIILFAIVGTFLWIKFFVFFTHAILGV
jgi:hypothetical protein